MEARGRQNSAVHCYKALALTALQGTLRDKAAQRPLALCWHTLALL